MKLWPWKKHPPNHLVIDIHDGNVVSGTLDIAILGKVVKCNFPTHHIAKNPGEMRKAKKLAAREYTPLSYDDEFGR